jgi:soluble lytic murein transglycosylase-like protein
MAGEKDLSLNLPANLIDALIQQESGWNANAYNQQSGATGLGQITLPALQEFNQYNNSQYSMNDMYDAQSNQRVAYWYLMDRIPRMLKAYKIPITLDNVLWAYNAGIGNVKKNRMPKETINYIKKVKDNLSLFGGEAFSGSYSNSNGQGNAGQR